ncbi:uncharacterized protein BYT42DRAFT_174389 [Radiomyces spectabilis]|uniref:uncharacterized protein n=1 Tax=Radiomyces spectabilis TaxID=64574 RepID=UPI00221F647A|nr:uncharacterized protein BYT42DRAFT_174389 [Radiomyces spectabilis]KAI8390912.1 hypothetical protein BYT42DRAFT_174389 [Radiomyces spectabilis]
MDRLCASLDSATSDDLIQKSALQDGHASPTIRLKALRKFRVLMLRAIQDRCMDSVDKEKLGRIMRNMGSMIEHVSELDIIACYAKAVDDQKLQTTQSLQSICHAIEIGALVLEILTASEFDKRIFPEGLILSCLQLVKNQLDNIIYPLFSLTIYDDDTTHFQTNARSFLQFAESMRQSRVDLATLLPLITRFLRYTFKLLQQDEIDDHMIVVIAYISMGPFFHEYDDQKPSCLIPFVEDMSVHPFEQLKYNSMDMLCKLFSNYPRHRLWMLEEILTSLNSMTSMDHTVKRYRLRNNTTIHIMSALFMQLIQSCCTVTDLTGNRNWLRQWELKAQKMEKANNDQQLSNLRSTLMKKASITWKSGIEAASQSAVYFVEMLLSKCKSRKKESYSVVEYRIIVEDILNDVMTVLNNPEWPVAELIIRVFSKILVCICLPLSPQFITH